VAKKPSRKCDPKQPLGEVFGYPIDNIGDEASRFRSNKLCPFNNSIPNCTKDKALTPLGVCSVIHAGNLVITCPIRFREQWIIAEDAANFFFPRKSNWTSLFEVRLNDSNGKSAGKIDLVLVSYDERGRLIDFGALEVQAVYISGNIRRPFEHFMSDPRGNVELDWSNEKHYPHPDFLSSSRKRLAPQLVYKGGILHAWKKKTAVALDSMFFSKLPHLQEVHESIAEIAWFVYDLVKDEATKRYRLAKVRTVYTAFSEALDQIAISKPSKMESFIDHLQEKLDRKMHTAPKNVRLDEIL